MHIGEDACGAITALYAPDMEPQGDPANDGEWFPGFYKVPHNIFAFPSDRQHDAYTLDWQAVRDHRVAIGRCAAGAFSLELLLGDFANHLKTPSDVRTLVAHVIAASLLFVKIYV